MILCNYKTDIGIILKNEKPFIQGINKESNDFIPFADLLLQVSNYIPIDGYNLFSGNKKAYCQSKLIQKKRRILIEDHNSIFELEYYEPFTNIDFQAINDLQIKLETIGEQFNDYFLNLKL